ASRDQVLGMARPTKRAVYSCATARALILPAGLRHPKLTRRLRPILSAIHRAAFRVLDGATLCLPPVPLRFPQTRCHMSNSTTAIGSIAGQPDQATRLNVSTTHNRGAYCQ